MQFEDFDNKLREAADHHHPAYNEKAWSKMERLLDEHLPQKKDKKRRIIFFLLLFLLLGGGLWIYFSNPGQPPAITSGETVQETENKSQAPGSPAAINPPQKELTGDPGAGKPVPGKDTQAPAGEAESTGDERSQETKNIPARETMPARDREEKTKQEKSSPGKNVLARHSEQERQTSFVKSSQRHTILPAGKAKKDLARIPEKQQAVPAGNEPVPPQAKPGSKPDKQAGKPVTIQQPVPPGKDRADAAVVPADAAVKAETKKEIKRADSVITPPVAETTPKKLPKKSKAHGLSLSLSAGPDISAVGADNFGKLRPVVGIGLGYTFAGRFTVRTGFYTASKVYTAKPSDYKPDVPPSGAIYLNKVDANCKVYEIPLTLAYQFGEKKTHNWFAAAGLSSYLMKKETYDYLYKYPSGQTYTHTWTFKDKNKHLFSVLSLSGGYSRRLSNTFTLSAEPYLKLPLGGIGQGNVQLNGAGVLFTLGAKLTGNKK